MTPDYADIARERFHSLVREVMGSEFETFFGELMQAVSPDFTPVRSQGPKGDWKCDGLEPNAGRYYQCYSPEFVSERRLLNKVDKTLPGLVEKWSDGQVYPNGVQEFILVVNDSRSVAHAPYPETLARLEALRQQYNLKACDLWRPQRLLELLFSLEDPVVWRLLRFSQADVQARIVLPAISAELRTSALQAYRLWLEQNCGYVTFDSVREGDRLRGTCILLERIFTPIRARFTGERKLPPDTAAQPRRRSFEKRLGTLLGRSMPRLALVAPPGAGKSMALKRLAIAYTFPERRGLVDDRLPRGDWFPLFLSCRNVEALPQPTVFDLLEDLSARAAMSYPERAAFREVFSDALRDGRALLLLDGLDEIADVSIRNQFVADLATFIGRFPGVGVVLTSRDTGYRAVAPAVTRICSEHTLVRLQKFDALRLARQWYEARLGPGEQAERNALDVVEEIWRDGRIRALATTPLLLTTLLIVKTSSGVLPYGRASLYAEACQVLVTLRAPEGYDDPHGMETLKLLSYVAFAMFDQKLQAVRRTTVLKLVDEGRRHFAATLAINASAEDWLRRFEHDGALFVHTSYEQSLEGRERVYEFRHSSFQEFLAARACVLGQHSGAHSDMDLTERLTLHASEPRWREVIILALLLLGAQASSVVARLAALRDDIGALLLQYLVDAVDVADEIATLGLRCLMRSGPRQCRGNARTYLPAMLERLAQGRYGAQFLEMARQSMVAENPHGTFSLQVLAFAAARDWFVDAVPEMTNAVARDLRVALRAGSPEQRIRAALVCMHVAGLYKGDRREGRRVRVNRAFRNLMDPLADLVLSRDPRVVWPACGALAVFGSHRSFVGSATPHVVLCLYRRWRRIDLDGSAAYPAWALALLPFLNRSDIPSKAWDEQERSVRFMKENGEVTELHLPPFEEFLRRNIHADQSEHTRQAALVIAYYRRAPWTTAELIAIASTMQPAVAGSGTVTRMLKALRSESEQSTTRDLAMDLLGNAEHDWGKVLHSRAHGGTETGESLNEIIAALIGAWAEVTGSEEEPGRERLRALLFQCLTGDACLSAEVARSAIGVVIQGSPRQCVGNGEAYERAALETLAAGEHGFMLRELCKGAILRGDPAGHLNLQMLALAAARDWFGRKEPEMSAAAAAYLKKDCASVDPGVRNRAVLTCMYLAGLYKKSGNERIDGGYAKVSADFRRLFTPLAAHVESRDLRVVWPACGALAMFGAQRVFFGSPPPGVVLSLYRCWRQFGDDEQAAYPAWALALLPLLPRLAITPAMWVQADSSYSSPSEVTPPAFDEFLRRSISGGRSFLTRQAALVIAYYRQAPWTDEQLIELLEPLGKRVYFIGQKTVRRMLDELKPRLAF